MTVKAKFFVTEVKHIHTYNPDDVCVNLTMQPVYDNGKGNPDWSKYTPSGKLEMTITNPPAAAYFEIGQEYYMEFTRCKDVDPA